MLSPTETSILIFFAALCYLALAVIGSALKNAVDRKRHERKMLEFHLEDAMNEREHGRKMLEIRVANKKALDLAQWLQNRTRFDDN